jgi:thiol-disulfide isomerase/thioredoxin
VRRISYYRWLPLLLILLLTACTSRAQPVDSAQGGGGPVQEKVAIGFRAPEITGVDAITGKPVKLSDLRGKPVFVNFWATWCSPCKIEMPAMEALYREAGGKLQILAVGQTPWETREQLAAFAKERGLTFSIVHDAGEAAERYGIRGVPTSVFIDPDGIIRGLAFGAMTAEQMRAHAAEAGYR